MKRSSFVCLAFILCLAATSCSSSKDPLSPSSGPYVAVSIAAPAAVSPLVDEQRGWLEQPLILTVANARVTGRSRTPITYEFEVATDEAFSTNVFSARRVAEGRGRTTQQVPRQTPGTLYWRARATNGTVTSPHSEPVKFEVESHGCHITPSRYEDPSGDQLSEEYAAAIVFGCGAEFPHTLAVFGSEGEAEAAAEELLLRTIWHLKLSGFEVARQRNPSLAISKDKLTLFIRGTWRAYDIYELGLAGVPNRIAGLNRIDGANPVPDHGMPD